MSIEKSERMTERRQKLVILRKRILGSEREERRGD